jgi:adenylate kinase family enzyme
MNVIEAYSKFKGQLVILISGMSGSGRCKLANNISRDFKIDMINHKKFFNSSYNSKVTLPNGKEVINWDSDDVINWESLNKEINEKKKRGVVVCGTSFPQNKIDFEADFHIHIKLSKENLTNKRQEYLEKHKNDADNQTDNSTESTLMNLFTYPYYLKTVTDSTKIHKFINANTIITSGEDYNNKIYDETFDYIIKFIQKWLNTYNENLTSKKIIRDDLDNLDDDTSGTLSDSTDIDNAEQLDY